MSLTPVTVRNATDASVIERNPSENVGSAPRLRLRGGSTVRNFAHIHFARPFPLGATISSATLTVYNAESWGATTKTMTLKRVTESWKAGRITWNNRPTVTTTGQVQVTKSTSQPDGTAWAFNVTTLMQNVANGATWYGFRLEIDEDTVLRKLYSANAGKNKPVLTVTYSTAPKAPTTLSPSGNRVVAVAKPTLRFDFTDRAGNTALNAIQVQINPTNVWTAPAFDSGTVTASEPQLDLNDTAYPGLAEAASTYWRVRVQDASGQWSAWSAGAQFQRVAKPTLSITNPAASPNNFVDEATPPIAWSMTGQTAWQVIIKDSLERWLYNSGKTLGTDTSWTLPAKIIQDTVTYTVVVRAWDSAERETTPGDTAYIEATREFTSRLNAGVTGVSNLTSTSLYPLPGAQLDWTRATMPDKWTITRDGAVIDAGIDGVDLFVSGTSYRYTDRGARPNFQHAYAVRAVVNGLTSDTNPTTNITTTPRGIWLVDDDLDISVQLLDKDEGSWAMGEQAETHRPLGAMKPVRITQALGGYEGSISGRIMTQGGVSVSTWESRMWQLKERPGRTYWLTLSDQSIPVVIGNVVIQPQAEAEITKLVSFDFWQVDDFPFEATL